MYDFDFLAGILLIFSTTSEHQNAARPVNQDETPRAIELEEQRITTAILAGVLPEEIVRIRRNTVR